MKTFLFEVAVATAVMVLFLAILWVLGVMYG